MDSVSHGAGISRIDAKGGAERGLTTSDFRPQTSDLWLHAGKGAKAAIYSFNGNKIITTSGGGMLVSDDNELIDYARFLSQQARDPFVHYEHSKIGYNYRISNLLAATGRGQLRVLEDRVRRRREIFAFYKEALSDLPGVEFMPEPGYCRSNRWLTVVLITPEEFGADRETVRLALDEENIESRPVWKPMHLQPVFDPQISQINADYKEKASRKGAKAQSYKTRVVGGTSRGRRSEVRGQKGKQRYKARVVGGQVAEDLFNRGLCLPSGTAMTNADLDRVIRIIRSCRH